MGQAYFSVIIPAYNAAAFIDRPLASLAAQRERDFEVVVVDDGSQDGTAERVAAWSGRVPGLRLLRQANAGPGAARNAGMAHSAGDYLLFLDADDELIDDALARFRAHTEANPAQELIYAGYLTVKPDGREKRREASPLPGSRQALFAAYLRRELVGVGNERTLLRRTALGELRFPEGIRNNEDLVFYGQALARLHAGRMPGVVARIHHRPDSLRHDAASAMAALTQVSGLLFEAERLPAEFLRYRAEFESGRMMALGGRLAAQGRHREAMAAYRRAFAVHPRSWLDFKALRRIGRSFWRQASPEARG